MSAERSLDVENEPGRWSAFNTWRETAAVTAAAAAVLAAINWLAFKCYFFAEAFVYLGSYRRAGNSFLGAVFSRHGHIFFRPVLWALNLPWNLLLPPDPFLYHLRNYGFVVLSVMLFHRLLLRMVRDRGPRVLAAGYFTVSKVHFTTIGYVATLSTVYMLLLAMGAMLCFLRWLDTKKTIDYVGTLLFVGLCIGSKDYGVLVLSVLASIAFWRRGDLGPAKREALRWGVPAALLFVLYTVTRLVIVGAIPQSVAYALSVNFRVALDKMVMALSVLGNLSLIDPGGVSGSRGISRLVFPDGSAAALGVEWFLLAAFLLLLLLTVRRSYRAGPILLVPLAWAGAFFLPTFLTSNLQVYYCNDLVAATALLIGIGLDRLAMAGRVVWAVVVLLLGGNAASSAAQSQYAFQYVGGLTAPIDGIAARFAGHGIERVICVGRNTTFWSFALVADGMGPMVPALFGDPQLEVWVLDGDDVPPGRLADPGTLVLDADRQFTRIGLPNGR